MEFAFGTGSEYDCKCSYEEDQEGDDFEHGCAILEPGEGLSRECQSPFNGGTTAGTRVFTLFGSTKMKNITDRKIVYHTASCTLSSAQ